MAREGVQGILLQNRTGFGVARFVRTGLHAGIERRHRPGSRGEAVMRPPVRSKLAFETGLKESVHILRTLHNDGLLVVIG